MELRRRAVIALVVLSACGAGPVSPADGGAAAGGAAGATAGGDAGGVSGGSAGGGAGVVAGGSAGGDAGGSGGGGDAGGVAGGAAGGAGAGGMGGGAAGLRNVTPPSFFGTLRVFGTVTVVNPGSGVPANGTWQPSTGLTFSYQWERCAGAGPTCSAIAGATQGSYRITAADFGARLRLLVTATDGTQPVSAASQVTSAVQAPTATECTLTSTTRSPGQVLEEASVPWTNPNLALTEDGMGATVTLLPGRSSQVLRLSGFGLNLPPGAVVTGVRVEVRHRASVPGAITFESLRFSNPTRSSQALPLPGTTWTTALQTVTAGSASTNPLGLLESSVNSPDFRFDLVVRNQAVVPADAIIDVARIIIDYASGTIVDGNPAGAVFTSVSTAAGQVPWTTPANARTADGMVTESLLTMTGLASETFRATNWGLTLPPGVTSPSVLVRMRRRNVAGSSVIDRRVALVRGSSTLATWPTSSNLGWFSTMTTSTFGSANNRWMGQVSAADVTASDFGVELNVDTLSGGVPGRPAIDEVLVSVVHSVTQQVTPPTVPTMATSVEPRVTWVMPGNAAMQDSASATATFTSALLSTRLVASDFNFGLPAGAFVGGLQLQVRKSASVLNAVRDELVQLRLGAVTSQSRANTSTTWSLPVSVVTYGSAQERWGFDDQLTAEALSAPDAVVLLSATTNAFSSVAQVESVQATVHWCPAP
ncbi:MAG: hypothetical protein SFW67_36180 [Myxococcaceae bacterium]|nr:hypothetical protein [Myxococcaceae bacterium]